MEKNKITWLKIVIILCVIIVLLFFHSLKIFSPIEGLLTYIFKPLQAPLYKLSLILSDRNLLREKIDLITENNDLKNQINQLMTENTELKKINEENNVYLIQEDFLTKEHHEFQGAKIINKFTTDSAQIITINQGKNKNITPGLAVISGEGIVIGKVSEVSDNTAKITLLTSNVSKIAGQIQNKSNTPGLIIGQHGLGLKMELLPKGDEINSGDIVITSGAEEKIPKGFVIGTVDQITSLSSDLFNNATVIPPIDYSRLSIVSVILN